VRLLYLKLANFRPFGEAELDLNADGLIGIRGRNGAGKSSLLAAVEWALYGQKRGPGSIPARRASAAKGEKCQVELQFSLDGHHYRVVRSETNARLWLDGDILVDGGQTAVSNAAVAALGINRDSFTSTFYARQREIQALNPQADEKRRRRQLEDLLGLTRLRLACDYAQTDAREQQLILSTLQSEAEDQDEAKRLLDELEKRVMDATPAVEAAAKAKDEAAKACKAARKALASASERAERAFKVQSEATVAEAEAKTAAERLEATRAALTRAKVAATELASLSPALERLAELRARDGELEAHRQTHERSTKLRERKHTSDAKQIVLAEELQALLPDGSADGESSLAEHITEVEQSLQASTVRLLALSEEVPALSAKVQEARGRASAVEELATVTAELQKLLPARAEQEKLGSRVATLEAQAAEVSRDLAEEQAHLEEIRRDGEAARCLRCKRPYGSDFKAIILEYEASIAELESRATGLTEDLRNVSNRREELKASLARLAAVEGRRSALESKAGDEPVEDAASFDATLEALVAEQAEIRATREGDEARLAELRTKRDAFRALSDKRTAIEQAMRDAKAESELLARELSEQPANGYDQEAHETLREELKAAVAADERARDLKKEAAQVELLDRRLASEDETAKEKQVQFETLRKAAEESASDREALKSAQVAFDEADEALKQVTDHLREIEEKALRESSDVQAAREALERARKQGQRVKKDQLELRYRSTTASILKDYNGEAQRRAFPTVARETTELLATLTQGRYSDARLDDSGALELFDDGAFQPLKRFSGGEQDLANLCLRIALSRSLSRQRGTEAGFIILDEVFGSQDLDRRRGLVEHMKALRQDFRQVFVVSHFDDVVDECDVQIAVARDGGVSRANIQTP
jgi:DNA repair protein SbcC/Rad50